MAAAWLINDLYRPSMDSVIKEIPQVVEELVEEQTYNHLPENEAHHWFKSLKEHLPKISWSGNNGGTRLAIEHYKWGEWSGFTKEDMVVAMLWAERLGLEYDIQDGGKYTPSLHKQYPRP